MKVKKLLSVITLFALSLTMLAGCGSDPIQDDLDNYFEDKMPAIYAEEDSITEALGLATTDNYTDDATLIATLTNEIIPQSDALVAKVTAVTTDTDELTAVHAKYIEAMTTVNTSIKALLSGIELGDTAMIDEASLSLADAATQNDDYAASLNALGKDYGWQV